MAPDRWTAGLTSPWYRQGFAGQEVGSGLTFVFRMGVRVSGVQFVLIEGLGLQEKDPDGERWMVQRA